MAPHSLASFFKHINLISCRFILGPNLVPIYWRILWIIGPTLLYFYTRAWKNAFDTLKYIRPSSNIFLTNGHWINIFVSRVRAGVNRQCAGRDQEGSAVSTTPRSKRAARSSNTLGHSVPRCARYHEGLGKYLSWDFDLPSVQCPRPPLNHTY